LSGEREVDQETRTVSFTDWVQQVFDHPVNDPAWNWDTAEDTPEPSPLKGVEYLTLLFQDPEAILSPYTDAQLNQGFCYLVDAACSNYMVNLIQSDAPWPARQAGIRSIATLFERLFAKRCSNHLSHFDEAGAGPLNAVCYMWWDLFPTWGQPDDPAQAEVDVELLMVMNRILRLTSVACQESALHGLGHWHMHYPAFVQETVDEFLGRRELLRPALVEYAECARQGYVQ
jgi:hypothetical protein